MTRQLRQAPSPGKIVSIVPLEVVDRIRPQGGFATPEGLHLGRLPARREKAGRNSRRCGTPKRVPSLPRGMGEATAGPKRALEICEFDPLRPACF